MRRLVRRSLNSRARGRPRSRAARRARARSICRSTLPTIACGIGLRRVVRRDRHLRMRPRAGSPPAAARSETRRASRPRAMPSSSAATMSASTCSAPRPALIRSAPPSAPSRLSWRNSVEVEDAARRRRRRQQAHQDVGAAQERHRARPRRETSRCRGSIFCVRLQPATVKPSRCSTHAALLPSTPSPMTPTATSLAAGCVMVAPHAARAAARRRAAGGDDASARAAPRIRSSAW